MEKLDPAWHTVQAHYKLNRDADYTQAEMEAWLARYKAEVGW